MKLLQIAFIAVMGVACLATYATSQTLHTTCLGVEQDIGPAPQEGF